MRAGAYARIKPRPDAISVLQQIPAWFEDYNTNHPHSGLLHALAA
jgi:transposase InsO family protein